MQRLDQLFWLEVDQPLAFGYRVSPCSRILPSGVEYARGAIAGLPVKLMRIH